jgi:hypothetical protein
LAALPKAGSIDSCNGHIIQLELSTVIKQVPGADERTVRFLTHKPCPILLSFWRIFDVGCLVHAPA